MAAITRPQPPLLLLLFAAFSFSVAHIDNIPVHPHNHHHHPAAQAVGAPNQDIVKICKVTSYRDLCLSTTQPFVPGNSAIDQNLIIRLELRAVRFRIKVVVAEVDKLLAQPPTLPPVADDPNAQKRYISGLSTCRKEMNETALDAAYRAADDLRAGNSYMFNQHMTSVTGAAGDCEDSFDGVQSTFWPASNIQEIMQMADNCMAIMQDATPEYAELPGGGRKRLL